MVEGPNYYKLQKHWRPELILLSFIVCLLGSYTTTQVYVQTSGTRRTNRAMLWILLAAISFGGTGIWCMHFVAMLAVDIGIQMQYTAPLTIATACTAVVGTFFTLLFNIPPPERASASSAAKFWHVCYDLLSARRWRSVFSKRHIALPYNTLADDERRLGTDSQLSEGSQREQSSTIESDSMYREFDLRDNTKRPKLRLSNLKDIFNALLLNCTSKVVISAALLGFDIFLMHFLGMQAMTFDGRIVYSPFFVLLSFLEAWATSIVAIIYMPTETDSKQQTIFSLVASVAISGMHYIGMFAATFETTLVPPYTSATVNYTLASFCAVVGITTCFISYAFLAHAVSDHKQRLQGYIQTRKELWKANAERRAFERSNRLKSDFIATASHELRTPLYSISGYSELLQTTNLDQEQLGYINLIKSATKALSLITDSVLDFSKLENDNLESQAKPSRVEIRKLVADCVRQCYMRKDHRSQNVTLLCLIDDNVPETCWVDEVYLSRVVFNLCGNSLKFTSEGFVLISLSLGSNPNDLQLQCVDSGIGIPAASLQDIFKPFRQVDSTLQRKFHGTGLGLAISISLMEKIGGTMAVKSSQDEKDPEKGTCFTCLFPHLALTHAELFSVDTPSSEMNRKLSIGSPKKNPLTFIRRQHRSHPLLSSTLSKYFKLQTIGLDNISRNASTSNRILTDIECFQNRAFRALFDKQRDNSSQLWFVCFDEDAMSKMDLDLDHLRTQKNVVLLRRPLCISRDLIALINDPNPDTRQSFEGTNDQAMSDRVNPILPVTRDRARDNSPRGESRQVTFALPPVDNNDTVDELDHGSQLALTPTKKGSEFAGAALGQHDIDHDKSNIRILLVEDNKINSKLGITLLKKCGLTAVAAENGQEAIDLIFADPDKFSLVLMDCQMPVMDGFTATRKIREWEENRGITKADRLPVIALTANVSTAAEIECLEAGADKFLPKPLTMKALRDEIGVRLGLLD